MKIYDYLDYITESKLDLLLETNIQFLPRFIDVLTNMGNKIAAKLMSIRGNDIDINTTYIDVDMEKDDTLTFVPEGKIKDLKYIVVDHGAVIGGLSERAAKNKTYPIKNVKVPPNGIVGEIVHELTIDELNKINKSDNWRIMHEMGQSVVHFVWKDPRLGQCEIFIEKVRGLADDVSLFPKSEIKVGRFVRRVLDKIDQKVSDKELEDFVNTYKSAIQIRKNAFSRFKIVMGEDIRKFYYAGFYNGGGGTLGGSCMRHEKCQPFFDIYVKNPEKVALLILNPVKPREERICARALLWRDTKDRTFMDRVYTNSTADETLFKDFAISQKFYYKNHQNNREEMDLMFEGQKEDNSKIYVQLEKGIVYKRYPYMDTLKFYNPETGIISNDSSVSPHRLESIRGGDGSCATCDGTGRVSCDVCGGHGRRDCEECGGSGGWECEECGGEGNVECSCDGGVVRIVNPETGEGDIVQCPRCKGKEIRKCQYCNGRGRISCDYCEGEGFRYCDECDGTGRFPCPDCHG